MIKIQEETQQISWELHSKLPKIHVLGLIKPSAPLNIPNLEAVLEI